MWIAVGTYYPDEGAGLQDGDASASFKPAARVELYGGFRYDADAERFQRDRLEETVLSGDIGQDDDASAGVGGLAGTNSCHVVWGSADAPLTLDGMTIEAGSAGDECAGGVEWSAGVASGGGGILAEAGGVFRNLVVQRSVSAEVGGGALLGGSSLWHHVTFTRNGGMCGVLSAAEGGETVLHACTFTSVAENFAEDHLLPRRPTRSRSRSSRERTAPEFCQHRRWDRSLLRGGGADDPYPTP